jgi:chromosome condensin MukBEF complex kleisin-like MukF subunit
MFTNRRLLNQILMTLQDVQTAVTNLGNTLSADIAALNTSLQAELTAIQNAIQAGQDTTSTVDQITGLQATLDSGLKSVQQTIDAETAKLAPPPPPPPPTS